MVLVIRYQPARNASISEVIVVCRDHSVHLIEKLSWASISSDNGSPETNPSLAGHRSSSSTSLLNSAIQNHSVLTRIRSVELTSLIISGPFPFVFSRNKRFVKALPRSRTHRQNLGKGLCRSLQSTGERDIFSPAKQGKDQGFSNLKARLFEKQGFRCSFESITLGRLPTHLRRA